MATANITLNLIEANDEDVAVTITTNDPVDGTALDLTGMELEAFLKTAASVADNDPTTFKASTTGGEITIINAATGQAQIAFPGSAVTTSVKFWRCDVISATAKRKTAVFGPVVVTDV